MSLKEIEYGSLASSSDLNSNFQYLEGEVSDLADLITTKTASFASSVATLNSSVEEVRGYKNSFFQPGMIISTVATFVPNGFLMCDGSEVKIENYPDLYAAIGTTFGSTDSTSFKLPDLRNKTLWGIGDNDLGTELFSKLPNISGKFGGAAHGTTNGAFSRGSASNLAGGRDWNYFRQYTFNASNSSSVYSSECNIVQPPAIVVNFVIKY